jgi:type II restriction enzyme
MLTGNIGEWSEIYTLLKIISDKTLFAGDKDLNKIEDLIFPIIKILREETGNKYEFTYDSDLVIIKGDHEEFRISINKFKEQASALLINLKNASTSTFSIPEIEEFITSFNCKSLKANSRVKTDIKIVVHDISTGTNPELGFSIKSQLGEPSTLLNAGKTTNFVYRIDGGNFSDDLISKINSIDGKSKIRDRITFINNQGAVLKYVKTQNPIFGNNLTLIDSFLPEILANLVLLFFTTGDTKMKDLIDAISNNNPIGYDSNTGHPFYLYKIKRLLVDIALGMMPSKVWNGEIEATGGYLIVKNDGDILCYHIFKRNEFEEYLINNTKLETAGSEKHDFGNIFVENNHLYIKLNLQIRFIK